ncbi:MAG: T9SS type A sorting domain-containing protein [bacterium]
MKRLSLFLVLVLTAAFYGQTNINGGKVSGLWTLQGSPYIIKGDIRIDTIAQLRIEPGVNVLFQGNYKLTVHGRLLAEGTVTDSINFTASDTALGWRGIRFLNTNDNFLDSSKISYAKFSYGKNNTGTDEEKSGGAIFILNSNKLDINNSVFFKNYSYANYPYGGGAIYIENSYLKIQKCSFIENYAVEGNGGAMLVLNSGINLRNSDFTNNFADNMGGGLYFNGNNGNLLRYLEIKGNKAEGGGGLALDRSLQLTENIDISLVNIIENTAVFYGGGILCDININPDLPLRNITISKNKSNAHGSAFQSLKNIYFENCIIDHNDKASPGIFVFPIFIESNKRLNFVNCVIADNRGEQLIAVRGESGEFIKLNIINSLIWHNEGGIHVPDGYNAAFAAYSTIQYPWDNFDFGSGVNHNAPDFRSHFNSDYHLTGQSPSIDKGSPESIFNDYASGYLAGLGTKRNDMGAYGGNLNSWRDTPIANFRADVVHGQAPLTVTFQDLSLNDPLEFEWDFTNDGIYDSYEKNPTFVYTVPGLKSVKLVVKSFQFSDTLIIENMITVRDNGFSGAVSGVWDLDTINILGNIYIPQDSTLQIMPGTHVYFNGKHKFEVFGTLIAEGTEDEKIYFFSDSLGYSSNYPYYEGYWNGIIFLNTNTNNQAPSILKHCSIKYGFETWIDELSNLLGGGIIAYKSNITLDNVAVDSCKGSGIYIDQSNIKINGSLFSNIVGNGVDAKNTQLEIKGSRFTKSNSGISVENSSIHLNTSKADSNLIGLFATATSVFINQSEFSYNHNNYGPGGGLRIDLAPEAVLEKVKVFNNYTTSEGGGIDFIGTNPILKNVEVAYNSADYTGGGINFANDGNGQVHRYGTFENCLIYKNETRSTNGTGAGFTLGMNCHAGIFNSTFANNNSKDFAAIANAWGTGIANVTNTIIYNNGQNYDLQVQGDNSVYKYSLIQGFYSGMDTSTTNLNNYDPTFINSTSDNYHLQNTACGGFINSPAIDTGSPMINDLVLDCEAGLGAARSDMGAYGGAGNRWNNNIMPACYYAGQVKGTWDCDQITIEGDIFIPQGDTLTILPGTKVYFSNNYKFEVLGVLNAIGTQTDTITFTSDEWLGWGGIKFVNLDSTNVPESIFNYCKFEFGNVINSANGLNKGGAISIVASSNITIEECLFSHCSAYLGGAIYVSKSAPKIEYNRFESNIATGAGGAMYLVNFHETLHRLEFYDNYANNGGAMFLSYSSPQITNVLAYRNKSLHSAAFAFLFNSSPYIHNLTSYGNISTDNSGATFSLMYDSNPRLINSILYHNSPIDIYINDGLMTATYSILNGGGLEPYFGEGCMDVNPEFRDMDNDNFHLKHVTCGSSLNSIAIDAGYPNPSFFDTHLDCTSGLGTIRIDMGYYGGKYYKETVEVATEGDNTLPKEYSLEQNYPNPFNPSTTISFSVPFNSLVSLTIYDILGRQVETIVNQQMNAGKYSKIWNANKFASGIYFYRLNAGKFTETKKMILVK